MRTAAWARNVLRGTDRNRTCGMPVVQPVCSVVFLSRRRDTSCAEVPASTGDTSAAHDHLFLKSAWYETNDRKEDYI